MELEKMQPLDLSEESTPVEEVTPEEMPEVSVSYEAAPEVVADFVKRTYFPLATPPQLCYYEHPA